MAITAVSYFQEEKEKGIEYLERQVAECPPRDLRFIRRGMEYLSSYGVYDVLELEDDFIDAYVPWLQERGIRGKNLIGAYRKTLTEWRRFHRIKEFSKLKEEVEACNTVEPTLKHKAFSFLMEMGIHCLEEIDWEIRQGYQKYLEKEIHGKDMQSYYLRGLDRLKLFDIEKKNAGIRAGRFRLKYEEKKIYLGYHPDYQIARSLYYCRNMEKVIWDFSMGTSKKLKYQVFTVLDYALEHLEDRELRDGYLAPLNFFYKHCVEKEISDLTVLEQEQIDDYVNRTKELGLVKKRHHQIVGKVQRILFLQAKEINWDANVWYMERFQFDETRYNPTRPVQWISFLDISDRKNREYLKMYVKYQLGVTSASVQNIWAGVYLTKAFLRFLDGEKLAVDSLSAADIDLYMRRLQEEDIEISTYNDKVAGIHSFLRFLTARGVYKKIPFYPEYYMKREPAVHHYRSVPQNTVTEIMQNLKLLPENLRLMYLHLWCLGLRINEVCMIRREGYYLKDGAAWLRIYQHKLKMEKVVPIPMMLYRVMNVYIERNGIPPGSYVFPNTKGGPYSVINYWHQMVEWCNELGIRCGDHVFQTHDYRHSVATALYEHGASIQVIREFLGHKHENMTRQYIDCIQKHLDSTSEQYYEEQNSLVSEWKKGSEENGN